MEYKKILRATALLILIVFIPTIIVLASKGSASSNKYHLVRFPKSNYSRLDELKISPLWVLDYGIESWIEISSADLNTLNRAGINYTEGSYELRLGGAEFDPRLNTPVIPEGWESVNYLDHDFYLIQFFGPTKDEWLDEIRKDHIAIVQYIHPFTYIVWGETGSLERVSSREFVRWSGAFHPAYRVQTKWQNFGKDPFVVKVLIYRGADIDTAISEIQGFQAKFIGRKVLNDTWEIAQFILPGEKIQEAAKVSGVYSIQLEKTDGGLRGEMSDQINVNNHNEGNEAYPGYFSWLAAAGLDGSGSIIANVDGGVQNSHPDLINRLITCSGDTCGGGASSNHGTHTAGIMAADGSSGVLDPYGFLRGLGMAPGASLVEQVYSPWFQQPGGMLLLMTDSFNNGASLSGNSWGPSGTPQGYDDDTMQVDIGVRDSDPDAPGNQPLSYILSIMNGNGGYQTQGTPDEAKNIFTIGSTKMQTGGGQQILEINDLSANTAHGPALDGRNIPHMVAPGCEVDSTMDPSTYGLLCGTSMASPHVSGAVALFIEYYRNIFGVDPSPAMVKAAFLPVAHDLAGNLDANGAILGHPFDYKQGWGRMDTAAVISPTVEVVYFDESLIFDNTGELWEQSIAPLDSTEPVRMMLVWTDAPGHGLGGSTPAWNNDLDLIVNVNGELFYGNNFDSEGWSQSGGSPDYMNNTEGVFLAPTLQGSLSVQVVAANINSDGIPNFGDETDQDFAFVCYNCTLGADFSMGAVPESQSICAPDPAVYELGFGVIGPYSDEIFLSSLGEPEGTIIDYSQNPVLPPATTVLTVGNTISATVGSYSIDILGSGTTRTHTTTVQLEVFDSQPGIFELIEPDERELGLELSPTFEWSAADQAASYELEVARDRNFTDIVALISDILTTTHTLDEDLEENQLYFWRVRAENVCGDSITDAFSFSTQTPVGACQVGTTEIIGFVEDFESGGTDWEHGGIGDTWRLVSDGAGTYYSADDVDMVSDQWLVSPAVELPRQHNSALLSFWNYQFIQDLMNGCADGALVEVSKDDGASWENIDGDLTLTDPYDGVINGTGNPLEGREAWCGDPQDWAESILSLEDYLGEEVKLRFRLGTDSYIGHGDWKVDNVELLTCEPTTIIERESFVSGLPGSVVEHSFILENLGQTETYQLELKGYEWETTLLNEDVITVTGGMSTTINIEVQIPDLTIETIHGMDTFTLTLTAENMPVLDITGLGHTLAETIPGVGLTPEMHTGLIKPGEVANYIFDVANLGNYTDTFILDVSGDWNIELPGGESTGVLHPGESIIVEVHVRAPETSEGGSSGMAFLRATSTLDPTVSASAWVNTMLLHQQFLPVIGK